jgi:hypothetical protein
LQTNFNPNATKNQVSKEMPLEFDVKKEEMSKKPYSNVVGSLMYCMVCTRLDITYVVDIVVQLTSSPGAHHWGVIKKILRYLQGTRTFEIEFKGNM